MSKFRFMTDSPELACAACEKKIEDQFYSANEQAYCPSCKTQIFDSKMGCSGYLPSLGLGFVAALLGGLLDFAVTAATDTQYGLIALVMGAMVGWAVRKGSRGRGSRWLQVIALGLTYLAISWSLSGLIIRELVSPSEPVPESTLAEEEALPDLTEMIESAPTPNATVTAPEVEETPQTQETPDPEAPAGLPTDDEEPLTGLALVIAVGIALVTGLVLPVVAVFIEPINAVFYGLAMWQATTMVKPVTPDGPHSLSELGAEEQEPTEPPPPSSET